MTSSENVLRYITVNFEAKTDTSMTCGRRMSSLCHILDRMLQQTISVNSSQSWADSWQDNSTFADTCATVVH